MASRDVAIVGAGQAAFGEREEGARGLFAEAVRECFASVDKGVSPGAVEEAFIGSMAFGGGQLGNLGPGLVEQVGLSGIPVRRVENACASSSFALRDAYLALRSGGVDVALVAGVEKMTDLGSERQRYWLGVSGDTEWERLAGTTFPGTYALMARRHMHEFGTTRDQMALVSVKNHGNAALNPKAHLRKAVTKEQVLRAPMVAHPLGLLDCCPVSDGAAALLLVRGERAQQFTDSPIRIRASAAASDHLALHDRPTITTLEATVRAGREALRQARLKLSEVDVAELHDAFTIAEIVALEDLGFCPKGEGGPFSDTGATQRDGEVPVNPSGGLKAKGHPLGATGAGQVAELWLQLRGQAGGRQVSGAEVGLAHNVGGSGAACAVHILSR